MQVLCKQSSSSHSFNGFALEYNRPIHRALTPSFFIFFFLGFLILYNFSEIGKQILLVTAQQYKAYLTYQNVFIAETYAFFC